MPGVNLKSMGLTLRLKGKHIAATPQRFINFMGVVWALCRTATLDNAHIDERVGALRYETEERRRNVFWDGALEHWCRDS